MSKKPYVYIASPYTHPEGSQLQNVKDSIKLADQLIIYDMVPFVPLLSHWWNEISPKDHDEWLELDLSWIETCDAMLRLEGKSSGAEKEILFARGAEIPIFYLSRESFHKGAGIHSAVNDSYGDIVDWSIAWQTSRNLEDPAHALRQ